MAIATEQEVREALAESRKADKATWDLINIIQEYVDLRAKFDPDYDHGYIDIEELADDDEDGSLDFHEADFITLQWKQYGRCGDYDYYYESFPIEHLWSDDWEADARAQAEAKKEREEREREAYRKRQAEAQERREREQLRTLLRKYPDEARSSG